MIKYLLKGILRDKSKSLLPVIIVGLGVMLTVILSSWMKGIMGESITLSANFNTGNLKIMTRAYAKESELMPNDLALTEVEKLISELKRNYPDFDWVKRIRFGALIDFPDSLGYTKSQGPVSGWALDILSPASKEKERFNLEKSLVSGRLPLKSNEALITNEFAKKFKVKQGDKFTLFGTTMYGSMAFSNFIVAGTVNFGTAALDRGAVIVDIKDAQSALAMNDAASEILGFSPGGKYLPVKADNVKNSFNKIYEKSTDEYSPIMLTLREQEGMAEIVDYSETLGTIMIIIFVLAMSIVLWNTGLIGGLRRYNEFGVRLAMGEDKNHLYKTVIYEGILIGLIGTIAGTIPGLTLSYLLQNVGLDISGMMKNSTVMLPSVARAEVTATAYYIGFIPGLFSMVLGSALSGLGIYKRQTSQLFKELEV